MLEKEFNELKKDSPADKFLRNLSFQQGQLISDMRNDQIREIIRLWTSDEETLKLVEEYIKKGKKNEVLTLLAPERNAFLSGSSVSITKSARYVNTSDYHVHDYFEIECVLDGTATHISLQGTFPLAAGDLILIPPHVKHNLVVSGAGTVVNLGIRSSSFRTEFKDIFERNLGIASYFEGIMYKTFNSEVILKKSLDDFLVELLLMMYQKQQTYYSEVDIINNHLATCFLYHLFEFSSQELIYDITKSSDIKANQMKQYIIEHCDNISLNQLAKHFNMSKAYCSRYIKENLHENYNCILENARIDKAKEYLIKTDIPILEISQKVGYCSQSYFISIFHKKCGISPLKFRFKNRSKKHTTN